MNWPRCAPGLLLLAACAGTTEPTAPPPATAPRGERLSAMAEAPVPKRTAPDGALLLNVEEVVRLSRLGAFGPLLAEADLEVAQADVGQARAAWIPEVALGARFFNNDGEVQSTEGDFLAVDKQNTFLGADMGLQLDLGHAIFASSVASAGADAARFDLQDARLAAIERGVDSYLDLVHAELLVRVADSAAGHARTVLELERARLEAGRGTPADLARVEAHLAATLSVQREAQQRAAQASVLVASALALEPGQRPRPDSLDLGEPPSLDVTDRSHPSLEAARGRVRASEENLRAAQQDWLWPTVELGASSGGFGPNLGGLEDQTVMIAGVTWHLNAGQGPQRDRARALLRRAVLESHRTRLAVEAARSHAGIRLDAARDGLRLAEDQLSAATRSAELAQERYQAGRGVLLEALEAEVERVRAEAAVATARVELHRAHYADLAARGALD